MIHTWELEKLKDDIIVKIRKNMCSLLFFVAYMKR